MLDPPLGGRDWGVLPSIAPQPRKLLPIAYIGNLKWGTISEIFNHVSAFLGCSMERVRVFPNGVVFPNIANTFHFVAG